jgi:hypothetical protein
MDTMHTARLDPSLRDEQPAGRGSLAGLVAALWRQTTTLVHQEAELARAELREKGAQLNTALTGMGIGAALLFAGLIALLLAAAAGLWMILPREHALWLAPLIVGLVAMLVGYLTLAGARRRLTARSLTPERTVRSLQRDAELAKEHMR